MATNSIHESFGLDKKNIFSLENKTKEEIAIILESLSEEESSPAFKLRENYVISGLEEGRYLIGWNSEESEWWIFVARVHEGVTVKL